MNTIKDSTPNNTQHNVIRWGIIGAGDVCEVKSGPGFQQAAESELVAVMRRDAHKAADYAHRHKVPRWYSNAIELINDPEVDVVYIATPPRYHPDYALRIAAAGKPAYVEKPMANNFAECEKMIAAFEAAGLPLFVAYYRRALPRFLKIRGLLAAGALGKIQMVTTELLRPPLPEDTRKPLPWRLLPEEAPGGYFDDLAPHMIDILQFLLGDISAADGHAVNRTGRYAVPDTVEGRYTFANKIPGTGFWNFAADSTIDRTLITGEKSVLEFATFGNDPLLLLTGNKLQKIPITNPVTIQQPLIQTVVDDLLGRGTCPSTGQSAARTNWVMDCLRGNAI